MTPEYKPFHVEALNMSNNYERKLLATSLTKSHAIPTIVLTGFLGSGKTTLVQHLLRNKGPLQIAVIVNEASTAVLDSQLVNIKQNNAALGLAAPDLSGGCVCCHQEGLSLALQDFSSGHAPDYVILEASGAADVAPLAEPLASAGYRLESVIAVVDAEVAGSLLDQLELARRQVMSADMVIINKCDLVTNLGAISDLEVRLQQLSPGVRMVRARYSQVPVDLILDMRAEDSGTESAAAPPPSVLGEVGFTSHEASFAGLGVGRPKASAAEGGSSQTARLSKSAFQASAPNPQLNKQTSPLDHPASSHREAAEHCNPDSDIMPSTSGGASLPYEAHDHLDLDPAAPALTGGRLGTWDRRAQPPLEAGLAPMGSEHQHSHGQLRGSSPATASASGMAKPHVHVSSYATGGPSGLEHREATEHLEPDLGVLPCTSGGATIPYEAHDHLDPDPAAPALTGGRLGTWDRRAQPPLDRGLAPMGREHQHSDSRLPGSSHAAAVASGSEHQHSHAHLHAGFHTAAVEVAAPLSMSAFQDFVLQKLLPASGVYRAKGILWFAAQRALRLTFHLSGRRRVEALWSTPWTSPPHSTLVLVAADAHTLDELKEGLMATVWQPRIATTSLPADRLPAEWQRLRELIAAHGRFRVLDDWPAPAGTGGAHECSEAVVDFEVEGAPLHGVDGHELNAQVLRAVNATSKVLLYGTTAPGSIRAADNLQMADKVTSLQFVLGEQSSAEEMWSVVSNVCSPIFRKAFQHVVNCKCGM